ncbi:TPR repeat-containing protein DDB_G0287407-like isoform X2 [Mytilus edulis]
MYMKYRERLEKENKESVDVSVQTTVKSCWNEVDKQCQEYKPFTSTKPQGKSGWKIVRVFVSSTFTDFFNEREILVKKIFPELREWCKLRHIHLIECDLRWGVPKEATTQLVIDTCLEELNRCHEDTNGQPFFLGLIGKRYGWIPDKTDVSDELKDKFQWVDNTSITFMEILHGALRCKSPNAAFFFRSDEVIDSIPEKALKRFIDEETLSKQHLIALKKQLQKRFPDQVYDYNCKVDGMQDTAGRERVKFSELDKFSDQVLDFFKTAITNMYDDNKTSDYDEEEIEEENQKFYIENKSELVVGQDNLLKILTSYLKGEPLSDIPESDDSKSFVRDLKFWGETVPEDNMIMCIKGHPGYGKSTLLSKVVNDFLKDGYEVFYHFVGCSASSKNTETLCKRLVRALEKKVLKKDENTNHAIDGEEGSVQSSMERLKCLLPVLREQQTKLCIVIDAVNELPDCNTYNHLSWLPPRFPGNIKCIISSADTHPPTVARLTEHSCYVCEVGPINKEAAEILVSKTLKKFNKQLDKDQLSLIVSRPCATNPLWLTMLLEELRMFGDFRTLDSKIEKVSDSVDSLLTDIVNRIIAEDETGLVKKSLCLLACAIESIQLHDLSNMLGDISNKEPVAPLYWSQTRRVLSPYIKEIGVQSNISFYHMEIRRIVRQLLITNHGREWYRLLALYYTKWCPDERSRSLFAPKYCLNANLKAELLEFYDKDPAAELIHDRLRSQHFENLRCQSQATVTPLLFPVVICQFCSTKTCRKKFRIQNKDCCVVCKSSLTFKNAVANLCNFHAFGHNDKYGKCLYCNMIVPKENSNVKNMMGNVGKLCMNCSFGHVHKKCAMVSIK